MSSDHWCTPAVVDRCNLDFFGKKYFDPCSNKVSILSTYKALTAGGLHLPWHRQTFENNPYSKMLRWVQKGARELAAGNVEELVTLWPVATSTVWWKQAVGNMPVPAPKTGGAEVWSPNPTIVFPKRLAFLDGNGKPVQGCRFDSVFFLYGPEKRHRQFLRSFNSLINWSTRGR